MTDTQVWLAIALPNIAVMLGMLATALVFQSLSARIGCLEGRVDMLFSKLMDIDHRLSKVEAQLGL